MNNVAYGDVKYFDTDLPHMIAERTKRINNIKNELNHIVLEKIQSKALDVEKAYQKKQKLKDIFPDCQRPIFIVEGLSYFLSPDCVSWLIEEMASYEQSAVIMDYWPENMPQISTLFARAFKDMNDKMILEPLKSFWTSATIEKFKHHFPKASDWTLTQLDEALSHTQFIKPEMLDPNQYFPLKMITGEKIYG